MTLDEVQRYLACTPEHALTVDVRDAPGIPGYVRQVELLEDLRVCVSFEVHGLDEGGAYYWGQYADLWEAICDLEDYINIPLGEWDPDRIRYPTRPGGLEAGHVALQRAIAERTVALPHRTRYQLASTYWRQFEWDS